MVENEVDNGPTLDPVSERGFDFVSNDYPSLDSEELYRIAMENGYSNQVDLNSKVYEIAKTTNGVSEWGTKEQYALGHDIAGYDTYADFNRGTENGFGSGKEYYDAKDGEFSKFDDWVMAKDSGYSDYSSYHDALQDQAKDINTKDLKDWPNSLELSKAELLHFKPSEHALWEQAKESQIYDHGQLVDAKAHLDPDALNRCEYDLYRGIDGHFGGLISNSGSDVAILAIGVIAVGALGYAILKEYEKRKLQKTSDPNYDSKDDFFPSVARKFREGIESGKNLRASYNGNKSEKY